MSDTVYHKNITGTDLHVTKAHASSHDGAGSDPFVMTIMNFGNPNTDGSWRIKTTGNDLIVERRESGAWVEKGAFLA